MPRLPPWLLRKANQHSSNLASLVPACRDIQSAKNELRWLAEYVKESTPRANLQARQLRSLCQRRRHGVPLQYILGSQPFGPLDIKCRPGVLIPRPETEAYVHHLVDMIKTGELWGPEPGGPNGDLSIVDLCTGTGCIPLLLYTLLQPSFRRLHVRGIDVAPEAVDLAKLNINHNSQLGNMAPPNRSQKLEILKGDIFKDNDTVPLGQNPCDILVSNPPYVSRKAWDCGLGQMGYSVRKYEPRIALVPTQNVPVAAGWRHEDAFYSRLFDIAILLKTRVALFELGDETQARRVLGGLLQHKLAQFVMAEVWRDWPDLTAADGEAAELDVEVDGISRGFPVKGRGQIRSILIRLPILSH